MDRRSLFKKFGAAAAAVAVAPVLVADAAEDTRAVVLDADTSVVVDTHTYVAWAEAEPLTFEELAAECKANGCNLEGTYSIGRLRYEYAHWRGVKQWADDTMTATKCDLELVAAWLDGLHEREARRADEEVTSGVLTSADLRAIAHAFTFRDRIDTAWEVDVANPGGGEGTR